MIRAHYFYLAALLTISLSAAEGLLPGEQTQLIPTRVLSDAKKEKIQAFLGDKLKEQDLTIKYKKHTEYSDATLVYDTKDGYSLGITSDVESLFRQSADLTALEKWLLTRAAGFDYTHINRWETAKKTFGWASGLTIFGLMCALVASSDVEYLTISLYSGLGSVAVYNTLDLIKERCRALCTQKAAIAASQDFDVATLNTVKTGFEKLHYRDTPYCLERPLDRLGLSPVGSSLDALKKVIQQKEAFQNSERELTVIVQR